MMFVVAPLAGEHELLRDTPSWTPIWPQHIFYDHQSAVAMAQEQAARFPGTDYGVFEIRDLYEVRPQPPAPVIHKVVTAAGEIVPGEDNG